MINTVAPCAGVLGRNRYLSWLLGRNQYLHDVKFQEQKSSADMRSALTSRRHSLLHVSPCKLLYDLSMPSIVSVLFDIVLRFGHSHNAVIRSLFFAETLGHFSLRHFGHLSHSCITSRRNSVH